ncbi:hypothetical protein ACN47E_007938 [Coniothyrium glycines]
MPFSDRISTGCKSTFARAGLGRSRVKIHLEELERSQREENPQGINPGVDMDSCVRRRHSSYSTAEKVYYRMKEHLALREAKVREVGCSFKFAPWKPCSCTYCGVKSIASESTSVADDRPQTSSSEPIVRFEVSQQSTGLRENGSQNEGSHSVKVGKRPQRPFYNHPNGPIGGTYHFDMPENGFHSKQLGEPRTNQCKNNSVYTRAEGISGLSSSLSDPITSNQSALPNLVDLRKRTNFVSSKNSGTTLFLNDKASIPVDRPLPKRIVYKSPVDRVAAMWGTGPVEGLSHESIESSQPGTFVENEGKNHSKELPRRYTSPSPAVDNESFVMRRALPVDGQNILEKQDPVGDKDSTVRRKKIRTEERVTQVRASLRLLF